MLAVSSRPCGAADTPAKATHHKTVAASWRSRANIIAFENIEGILILKARIRAASHDTAGAFVLDTGAGYFALDRVLARTLGVADDDGDSTEIGTAHFPVDRLELGSAQIDQVAPVITFDANVIRQVSDRNVLGLLGQRIFANQAILIDYRKKELALFSVDTLAESRAANVGPIEASRRALEGALGKSAKPVRFRNAGDGKILVRVRVANSQPSHPSDPLTMILDTGATKTVLFDHDLISAVPRYGAWPTLKGLSAPTLVGSADASLARVPRVEVAGGGAPVVSDQVDIAIIRSELAKALSDDVGERVHGLLGYSFLRRFRVAIDYPHQVLWLEPVPHTVDERPYEYSHVGLQIERHAGELRVVGVVAGSPAAHAGIVRGDVLTAIDRKDITDAEVVTVSRALEGPPGSSVRVTVRHEGEERTVSLVRRRLL